MFTAGSVQERRCQLGKCREISVIDDFDGIRRTLARYVRSKNCMAIRMVAKDG